MKAWIVLRLGMHIWLLSSVGILQVVAQQYTITAMGNLSGSDSLDAFGGVNAFGQAALSYVPSGGAYHALLYDVALGQTVDLGSLGGKYIRPNAIDDSGAVVGVAET